MSLTVTQGRNNLSVVFDGSADFDMSTYHNNGVRLSAIRFYPSAANDIMHVREASLTGVTKWKVKDTVGGGVHYECVPHYSTPCVKASECTLGTPANALLIFEFV